LLAACDGGKETDVDGDGVEAPADCDDNDAAVLPGAVELCDGVDNDCDGQVDEGVSTQYWPDADGDGFGDASAAASGLCEATAGFAANPGDCDDGDASVNPDAQEDCTMVDRNCDLDAYAGASDLTEWFVDSDGDGFGAPDASTTSCAQPAGYADNSDDCDDFSDTAYPGATEICNNRDDDCNQLIDDDADGAEMLWLDTDADGYGDPATGGMYCPGNDVVDDDTDCDDTNDQINPGRPEICDGIDNDCDPSTDEDVVSGDVYYADADGDGYGLTGGELYACDPPTGAITVAGDCDDGDATISPDADELCDAVDRNCDGDPELDATDATTFYADNDSDGVGAEFDTIEACSQPAGYLTTGGDCDDDDPAFQAYTVYPDADGDGFGDANSAGIQGCSVAPYTEDASDCNDASATDYPGAPELCDGGIDNDCDPLTDENFVAVWYEDADGDGYGDEGNTYMGCDPLGESALLNPTQIGGDCDDTDPLYNPALTPDCVKEHCGTISGDETWVVGVEHIVTCDVNVEGSDKPKLTIEDGTVVTFTPGTKLTVGDGQVGSIDVQGFGTGVLFTSSEKIPQEGDYDGLHIGPDADPSLVQGLTIEYAGASGAGLELEGDDVTVWESVFHRNSGDGVLVSQGEPLIYDSMMIDNENNGLYVEANQGLSRRDKDGTFGPSFTGNYIAGNGARPVTIPGSHADELALSSELNDVTSPNAILEIELLTGVMRRSGTWERHPVDPTGAVTTDGLPYYVAPNVAIDIEDGPDAVLTIADDVVVVWDEGAGLEVGVGFEGSLFIGADGAPGNVLFTAPDDLIDNNLNWDGVQFGAFDGGSKIYGLTIEYGGGNSRGNLYINASSPIIADSVIRASDSNGIEVAGAAAKPVIVRNVIEGNDEYGVFVASSSAIARGVNYGANTFAGNTITGNGFAPIAIPPAYVGELDVSTTFTGNGVQRIIVHGGQVTLDATWPLLDEPYQIEGDVEVAGPTDPELILTPGSTFYMGEDTTLEAGISDDGSLIVDAVADPIRFQSAIEVGEGDWFGIYLGVNGPSSRQSILRGAVIDSAGGSDTNEFGGAVELIPDNSGNRQGLVIIDNVEISNSSKNGLYMHGESGGSYALVSNVVISNALVGYCLWMEDNAALEGWSNVQCDTSFLARTPYEYADMVVSNTTGSYGGYLFQTRDIEGVAVLPSFQDEYYILEPVSIAQTGSLTIESGAVVNISASDVDIDSDGYLELQTGATVTGNGFAWQGIYLGAGTAVLTGGTVEDAGLQGDGALVNAGAIGALSNVTFNNVAAACDVFEEGLEDPGPTCPGNDCLDYTGFLGSVCY
jgi:hypothetical protein